MLKNCIEKMPGVRSIAMISVRTTILTSERDESALALFIFFFYYSSKGKLF